MNWIELVRLYRGQIGKLEALEATHFGAIAVVNGDGKVLHALGDIVVPVHLRSTAKPFQLMPFLLRKLDDKCALEEADIALLMASHGGEPVHVERLSHLMPKLGVSESELLCGAHAPMHEASKVSLIQLGQRPSVLHNNCSGKHCAMVATSKDQHWEISDYINVAHPLQKEISKLIIDLSGVAASDLGIGIDGCSAPTFILPLDAIARLYAALAAPKSGDPIIVEALHKLFKAGTNHPEMIAGAKRLDTLVMQCAKGKVFAKTGAEGVYAMAVAPSSHYPTGLGVAIKIADGDLSHRARNIVVLSLLVQLGVLTREEITESAELSQMIDGTITNLRGLNVAKLKPTFQVE